MPLTKDENGNVNGFDLFGSDDDIYNMWDRLVNGNTNKDNKEIAEQNFAHQLEREKIEDYRYDEETAYNRALQQTLFDREDTALERQAQSLSSMGINPLSQNMNGLGAGSQVTPSGRTAETAQNNFQSQKTGMLGPSLELLNSMNNLQTQGIQRDSLRQQVNLQKEQENHQKLVNENQAIQNAITAKKYGVTTDENGNYNVPDFEHTEQEHDNNRYTNDKASAERNERENKFQKDYGVTDNTNDTVRLTTDITNQGIRATQAMTEAVNDGIKTGSNYLDQAIDGMKTTAKKVGNGIKNGWKKTKDWFKDQYNKSKKFYEVR